MCKVTIIIETEDTWTERGGGLMAVFEGEAYTFTPGIIERVVDDKYQTVTIHILNPKPGHKLTWLGGGKGGN